MARLDIERALVARFGKEAARFAAPAAGKPGIAFALATDESARAARKQSEAEFYRLVGSKLTERFAWAAALADERDSQKRGELIETRLVNWSELVRDAAVAATGVADRAMRPDREDESRRLAAKVTTRDLVDLAQRMERWRRDVVETTVSARMLLELFALRLPYDETFSEAA